MLAIKCFAEGGYKVVEVENKLEVLQKEVGGYIEVLPCASDGTVIICNEEGKINNLPVNRSVFTDIHRGGAANWDIICGDFIICGTDGQEFADLNDSRLKDLDEQLKKRMHAPLRFFREVSADD